MKYYKMHEVVYRKLKAEGGISWDKSRSLDEMLSHSTNLYLKKFLSKLNCPFSGLNVLDLGTGTGTSALFMAKNGSTSVGVDISPSAIDIAQNNAKSLGVTAEFIVGDVLGLDLKKKFDLIIDSTILHCIVGSQDRESFYQTVKSHMSSKSYFFINTMLASGDMESRFPSEYFLFLDDVLWSLGLAEVSDRKTINGKSYFPHRTLLTEAKQIEEFEEHGFEVVLMETEVGSDGYPNILAVLRLAT